MLSLTDRPSLIARKYLLGPLFIVISILLLNYGKTWLSIFCFLLLAIGIFFVFFLSTIKFDDTYVYIGNRRYLFNQVAAISAFEVNLYIFPYIIINDNGRKRRYITDTGQAGLVRVVIGMLFPSMDPLKNMNRFTQLMNESKSSK